MKKLIVFLSLLFLCQTSLAAVPYVFTNGTTADATEVNADMNYFEGKFSLTSGHTHNGSDSAAIASVDVTAGGTGIFVYASGDVTYASTATTLSRRALGARGSLFYVSTSLKEPTWLAPSANIGVSLKSAGTNKDPVWSPAAVGSFTKNSSGNYTVSGLSAQPSTLIIHAFVDGGMEESVCYITSAGHNGIYYSVNNTSDDATTTIKPTDMSTSNVLYLTDGTNTMAATFYGYTADGFILNFSLTGTQTAIVKYYAF